MGDKVRGKQARRQWGLEGRKPLAGVKKKQIYKKKKKKQKKSATGTQNTCTRSKKNDNPKPAGWRCRRFVYGFGFAKGFVWFCKGFALVCKCAGQ